MNMTIIMYIHIPQVNYWLIVDSTHTQFEESCQCTLPATAIAFLPEVRTCNYNMYISVMCTWHATDFAMVRACGTNVESH